ncbi:unnamed protein product [Adineta steineri]|uniref:Alcohol acetyltransferase n=1 Tax=Adineta steineri TaxID=433720 RepID=A0A819ZHL7_9BILA|nr:unnamed protein product [Adineta steineri]CAF4163167.1 unnamed protein product [Adineta steineri]
MSYQIVSTLPLNGIEKFMCVDGGWNTIAHAAHLTGNPSVLINNMTNTVQCLLKRHPRMRTRIRVDENQYFIDNLEYNREYLPSDLFVSITEMTNESWQEVVECGCNRDPYSNNGTIIFPTFHFTLLINSQQIDIQSFHLILFQNHCVSDGQSGFILINDFLTLSTSPNLIEISEPLNTEILPLIGSLIPRPYGPLYHTMSFIAKRIILKELRQLGQPRIPVKVSPHDECESTRFQVQRYKMKFLFVSSSTDLFSKLHRQSRLHNVTLNGPLLGCFLLAIHHCFPLKDKTRLELFEVGIPFNMRSRLPRSPLTPLSVGCFIGAGEFKLKRALSIQSTHFWSLAYQCMTITRNQLKQSRLPLAMNIFADVLANQHEFARIAQLFPEGRQSEIAFSNVGKYPFPCEYNNGEVQLSGIHVINSVSGYRNSSGVYVTCADNGQLDFAMAHEMESNEIAKHFLDYYLCLIEICADSERCKTETTLGKLLQMVEFQ